MAQEDDWDLGPAVGPGLGEAAAQAGPLGPDGLEAGVGSAEEAGGREGARRP